MTDPPSAAPRLRSYRDPSAAVHEFDGRIFRTLSAAVARGIDDLRTQGLLDRLMASQRVIQTWPVALSTLAPDVLAVLESPGATVVEHETIPFISMPYEWPFSLLQRAALHHLDLHADLLRDGFTLSDGSAYNVQFRGTRPVFIDLSSVRRYHDGEYWGGYRQFCEQCLNPLLLTALTGVAFQRWLRGSADGVSVDDLARLLPARTLLSFRLWLHVRLHARLNRRARLLPEAQASSPRPMSRTTVLWMLAHLRRWIASLRPRGTEGSVWGDYSEQRPYAEEEAAAKREFVARWAASVRPGLLLDLGCNTGEYSAVALEAGAQTAVGFDTDQGALEAAVARADAGRLDLLPLVVDVADPSPDQGWAQQELDGTARRSTADGVLALALLHHLVIGRNVPLSRAVGWMTERAPSGIIEFVPRTDPMVQRMLRTRADMFPDYDVASFRAALARVATIEHEATISASGRALFVFRR